MPRKPVLEKPAVSAIAPCAGRPAPRARAARVPRTSAAPRPSVTATTARGAAAGTARAPSVARISAGIVTSVTTVLSVCAAEDGSRPVARRAWPTATTATKPTRSERVSKRSISGGNWGDSASGWSTVRRVRFRARATWILLLGLAGCGRCSSASSTADGGADGGVAPLAVTPLPPPSAWTFAPVRTEFDVAAPESCTQRAPLVRAGVAVTTRFVAEPRTLGQLVIADGADAPPRLTGAAALLLDPAGPTRDPRPIPWLTP